MIKKPKVIAFRITDEEYEAVQFAIGKHHVQHVANGGMTVVPKNAAQVIEVWISRELQANMEYVRKQKKSEAAKAKRQAKKAAQQ